MSILALLGSVAIVIVFIGALAWSIAIIEKAVGHPPSAELYVAMAIVAVTTILIFLSFPVVA